jgi:peptidyl-prolyl cis-trans isomerase D
MFKELRSVAKSKIVGILLMGFLVAAFGLWGVSDIFRGAVSNAVAQVGNTEISGVELSRELRGRMRVMGQQMNTTFTMEQARQFGIDQIALEELLSKTAMNEIARDLGLTASDDMVRSMIQAMPAFQGMTGPQIVQTLNSNGFTEQAYVESIRNDIARLQLVQSVATGMTPPRGMVDLMHDFFYETRVVNYLVLTPDDVGDIPAPTEEELSAFHASRPDLFNAPEYRSIDYVVIGPDQVADQIEITEDELREEFENPVTPLGTPETREIRQMVFDDQDAALAARARIEEGTDFLTIAEERGLSTEDIERGELTAGELDDASAEAAFAIEAGGVTEPVQGPFGWLLYSVVSVTEGTDLTFEEARDQLRANIVALRAANLIADIANAYSDATAGGATLTEAAAEIGIDSVNVEAVDIAGLTPDGTPAPVPDEPTFLQQAFTTLEGDETFLFEGEGDEQIYYAVRVNAVTPATLRPLETVRAEVEAAWQEDARANALLELATQTAADVRANGLDATAENLERIVMVSTPLERDSLDNVFGGGLLEQIFSVPQGSVVSAPDATGQNYVVARIEDVSHPVPDLASDTYNQIGEAMAQQMAEDVVASFSNAAREEVGVTTYPDNIDIVLGQGVFY